MKLINIMPVHNEGRVLGLSLRAVLRWCDEAVVLLHACTDDSEEIAKQVAAETGRVTILTEPDPAWREMLMRQAMLEAARQRGATNIAILDADEILSGNLLGSIRKQADLLQPGQVMEIPGFNMRGGIERYHANGIWGNRWFTAIFCDHPRFHWSGDRFHHRHPMGPAQILRLNHLQGGIMHLWGASEEHLIAKHRLYKLTERARWPEKRVAEIDRLYSLAIYGQPGDTPSTWRFAQAPESWWEPYRDLMRHLNLDADSPAEADCARLVARHGSDYFAGLDLFGMEAADYLCEPDHAAV